MEQLVDLEILDSYELTDWFYNNLEPEFSLYTLGYNNWWNEYE